MASFSSLDARIVEFPVLIRDLPVWAFPSLTCSSSVVGAVLPGPDCWAVSAAWKHLSSRLLVGLLSDAGRSRLWTSTFEWLRPLPERSQHGKALAFHVVGEFGSVQHDSGWMFLASLPTAASLKDKSMDVASASLP